MAGKENPGSISSSMAGVAIPVWHQACLSTQTLRQTRNLAHARQPIQPAQVESRTGAVAVLRFPSPLIKPDVRISRIRLSDWFRHGHMMGGQCERYSHLHFIL